MQVGQLKVNYGQAYIAPDRRSVRSSMATAIPSGSQLATKGVAAVIADSTWRNAIAKQAGETCVKGFLADYFATPDNWDVKTSVKRVLSALNTWMFSQSRSVANGSYVSSFSSIILRARTAYLFHLGDTLVFRLRGLEFEQINREHTTYLGGYRYPSRALGMDPSLDIDFQSFALKQGDIFLLTTQAARGTLTPSDYVRLIREYKHNLHQACDQILKLAIEKAGARGYSSSNFCFQLVQVETLPLHHDETLGDAYSVLPVAPRLEVGDTLDAYQVDAIIEQSARSHLYLVRDQQTAQVAVLKTPPEEKAQQARFLQHFMMQQWVMERVNSPHVVRVLTSSKPRNYLYYLLEYVQGERLSDYNQRLPLADLHQKIVLIEKIAKGLRALHRREILHQHLTPENILVDAQGQVKLVDFAACCLKNPQEGLSALALAREVGFTPYTAPEYYLNREPNETSDQFSLAAVAYELLTGQVPYADQVHTGHTQLDFARLEYRPSFQLNPIIPVWMDAALRRALQPNPELRYARLSEFIYDLKKPNPRYTQETQAPLMQRNPLAFWQGLSGLLLLLLILSLMY
ncbi:Serine/threonine protein kinase [Allopseudospirillum japonicum]|uniref:Serine/threonine protein kinase n=1 Tax=Allopseudospirillum japonicum TaxID=64971 RepID=A0A1H6QT86_9GAMM|nr:bifunctional protein-serine/threonine kinase/phosphatase [Allopseudospirillum japonicum]SEI42182.1 Serine/threonine protein kinase [Allopseudospirillum japonicum]